MGIQFTDACNLLQARVGQTHGKVVTLGRQSLFIHRRDLKKLRSLAPKDSDVEQWFQSYKWGDFAEQFLLKVLKFDTADSIDFSAYEQASIVHDLGEQLPVELIHKFDLAIDCGTLEHVFHFPTAIGNLMKLARVGGSVYISVPCNNLAGHGFYQFSPELMYRVFSKDNGFKVSFVRVAKARYPGVELTSNHKVFDVSDTNTMNPRINLLSSMPVYVMAIARHVDDVVPFTTKVLQSDYVSQWADTPATKPPGHWLMRALRRFLPFTVMNHVEGLNVRRKALLSYRSNYHRVSYR
jgi:hypothetical protein